MHVLENEVKVVVLLDEFEQLDDVGVVQLGEDADLVERDALLPILVLLLHFLDGDQLPGALIESLDDSTEAPVA